MFVKESPNNCRFLPVCDAAQRWLEGTAGQGEGGRRQSKQQQTGHVLDFGEEEEFAQFATETQYRTYKLEAANLGSSKESKLL